MSAYVTFNFFLFGFIIIATLGYYSNTVEGNVYDLQFQQF